MGIWERFKSALVSTKSTESREPVLDPSIRRDAEPVPEPARQQEAEPAPSAESFRQSEATARFYAAERVRAKAAGQTVKGYRAGYMPDAEAKAQLEAGPDGLPPLRLVSSNNGLDLAFPDGQLMDYKNLALRHYQIFAFRVVGMAYYEDLDKPFKFRNGQSVGMCREADNEHDANAVAITIGRSATKVGYVNKQRAKWVAQLLDSGQKLEGIVLQSKAASPRVLLTTPEILAHLRRP
ncbi:MULTISPECIES: HIRAN domain-containing protein [unclassified Arthrobacter]|uniref:HIRAN domain-containing protein n=1 Tax=unclassified Arthrobacter TaxID=235627 RepID=UPI002499EE41|nr:MULTISPECIES: HIRAN domain-containing protein [unclassified Arthrobacter]MDI3241647.1 HIRAN domain-containing protein [Arthrobacter sp. AL05]